MSEARKPRSTDVVVVGGGVIGCAVAWRLARRGLGVVVIERDTPGHAATWAAGGMLSPLGETGHVPSFLALAEASLDRWPAFADELLERGGTDVELGTAGKLHIAFDATHAARLGSLVERGAGFEVETLTGDEARALEPALAADVAMGVLVRRDYRVNVRRLAECAWRAAEGDGAVFLVGATAGSVELGADGRFDAVRLDGGTRIVAEHVVIAGGAWSGALHGLPRELPIRPVRGQMFAVESSAGPLVEHVIEAPGCYLVPRARGRLVVGATAEDVGFEPGPTPSGLHALIEPAVRTVPAIGTLPIAESWAGFRPGTPDGLPILGPDPAAPGVWYATGHFRNGILLAPVTADVVSAAIAGDPSEVGIDAFRPDRFDSARKDAP